MRSQAELGNEGHFSVSTQAASLISFLGGGTTTTNGPGPNGVLVTPNRKVWAGDGNSTVRVADVDPDSPNYLNIIGSISTTLPWASE